MSNFDFQTSYLVKINIMLIHVHIWHLVGILQIR